MRLLRVVPIALLAACSSDDRAATDARPPADALATDATALDAAIVPDAAVPSCATAPTGDWSGAASVRLLSAGSSDLVHADVHWSLASTADCIDHYLPSGTATFTYSGNCHVTIDPPSAAIASSDGELVIDRSTAPATYALRGATSWSATVTCEGETPGDPLPIGGPWASATGSFDGPVIAGGADGHEVDLAWSLLADQASFPPPGPACSEPATDQWHSTSSISDGASATLVWTRVSTDACVDTFALSGTVTAMPLPSCADAPASAPAGAADGTLTIDRSTAPPTFAMSGASEWAGTTTCTLPEGTTQSITGPVGGSWAAFAAAFAGSSFSATTSEYDSGVLAWSLTRG